MHNSNATGCALPPAPSTAIAAAALSTALAAWRLHGLLGLQLPLLGGYLCGRKVFSNERRVQFDPQPAEQHQQRQAGLPAQHSSGEQ